MNPGVPILWTVVLLAAKGVLLVALAWTAVRALKHSGPFVRRRIWFSALAGLILLPMAAFVVPHLSLPVLNPTALAAGAPSGTAAASTAVSPVGNAGSGDPRMGIAAAYVSGMAVSLAWMVLGRRCSAGMRRRARRLNPAETRELLDGLGIGRATGPIRITVGDAGLVPSVSGVVRPAVLLPAGFREWPEERLKAAILHEAAHIRHRDLPARLAGSAACLLHWFNPLAWIALRRMIREQESACDLFVVGHGLRASRYAADILSFARPAGRIPECGPAGMAGAGDLHYRLEMILDPASSNPRPREVSRWIYAAAAAVVLLTSAFMPWEDFGRFAVLRDEAAEFLFSDIASGHRNLLAEKDDALYLRQLSAALEGGRFNKKDFEAHLARLRTIEDQAAADGASIGMSARTGRAVLLDRYLPTLDKYSPVLNDLKKTRRPPPES